MLKLRDADTGEADLECYTVPEGKCMTLRHIDPAIGHTSIILTPEQAGELAKELVAGG